MPVTSNIVIKVTLCILFLLYAYFMIGGYTPLINCSANYCNDRQIINKNEYDKKIEQPTIYQMAPYF